MSEQRYKVKDWKKFQHFCDRRPPWIRLYRRLITKAKWVHMSPAHCKTLIGLWLVASDDDTKEGYLPDMTQLVIDMNMPAKLLKQHIEALSEWIVPVEGLHTDCTQDVHKAHTNAGTRRIKNVLSDARASDPISDPISDPDTDKTPVTPFFKTDSEAGRKSKTAEILQKLGAKPPTPLIDRVMAVAGDGEYMRPWWQVVIDRHADGLLSDLIDDIDHICNSQNPITRQIKDMGAEFTDPGKWLVKQCKDRLGKLPRFPQRKEAR